MIKNYNLLFVLLLGTIFSSFGRTISVNKTVSCNVSFDTIEELNSNDNSNKELHYKLAQESYNYKTTIHTTIFVSCSPMVEGLVSVYPSPSKDIFYITGNNINSIKFDITTAR